MPRDPARGRAALRRGRVSISNAEYFLTVCTDERRSGLTAPVLAAILAEMRAMGADIVWRVRWAVVMPDHINLLVILGERLTLGKSMARLKAKTSAVLGLSNPALKWERDFYDHHIRPEEDRLSLFLYIFLNPYRAGLCSRTEMWPWYYCHAEDWMWFKDWLEADRPIPEGLKTP